MSRSRHFPTAITPRSSRSSSTRRSTRGEPMNDFIQFEQTSRKRLARTLDADSNLAMDDGDKDKNHNSQSARMSISLNPKGKGKAFDTRASTSSVSTINDEDEGSGYSTPITSGKATPNPTPRTKDNLDASSSFLHSVEIPISTRRGRTSNQSLAIPASASKAFERARKLRDSGLGLGASRKRKRVSDEEEGDDSDNTPDAQLARALQEQEDAKAAQIEIEDSEMEEDLTPRRTSRGRPLRIIKPKEGFVVDFSEDELEVKTDRKRFPVKKETREVEDSDASDFIISEDESQPETAGDSRSSPDIPLSTIGGALTQSAKSKIKAQLDRIAHGTSARSRRGRISVGATSTPKIKRAASADSSSLSELSEAAQDRLLALDSEEEMMYYDDSDEDSGEQISRSYRRRGDPSAQSRRARQDRERLEQHHPELFTMWEDLKNLPVIKTHRANQPTNINRELKPFQLEGLSWMREMEKTDWGGGLLGDEMGMGKTIQAVSLIMSDYPAKMPSLVLIPPVALMQWQQEIGDYTDGTLKTFVFHGTNTKTKDIKVKELMKYDVILMSYNSLESMYRHQEKGRKRKVDGVEKMNFKPSPIHQIQFHRVILDEAHNIKQRTTGVAKACFALKADHKWCLSGTPLQNRIGEFFSLVRFLNIEPFSSYMCKQCPCTKLEWSMDDNNRCKGCKHSGMQHVSVFNQELLNPIQKYGNKGPGKFAFEKLRLLTDRFMLRRVKRDHSSAMELPAKEIVVDRQFFGEVENDFAGSIMNNSSRKFETYVAQGVLLNNYANIFGLIMQMRQVADHPDLILKKNSEGGANILNCCICDETAEDAIRSACKHDFCRQCVKSYVQSIEDSGTTAECPRCHIPLSIDMEQPEMEQDEADVKKSSIINRIKMENWTSSSKIEALVYDLHLLRSRKSSSKSIIFSQFTTMLQLVEWRLRRAGITTVMLDGSMTPAQRQASINTFMTDVNVECFLVSLKAGGVALNLTEASKVFLIDPWWNPAAEWQSADRCHRIGQSRPCTITRLCIEDSVESRMVLLQEKKANMINSTINSDQSAMEALTPEDMQFLFRGS